MKVVAFNSGRKFGNTETLIKEALMAIEERGHEVCYCRLADMDIRKDTAYMRDLFLDSDAVIFGAPVWSCSPNFVFTDFRDAVFGPQMDLAFWQNGREPAWARGRGKQRPGALVSVGGAPTHHWVSLGLPTLYTACFSAETKIVDYLDVNFRADVGACAIEPGVIARARKMGENLADAMEKGDFAWRGEPDGDTGYSEEYGFTTGGICPSCHMNLLSYIPNTGNRVECPMCGIKGELKVVDGKIVVDWDDFTQNIMTLEGKRYHDWEIQNVRETIYGPKKHLVKDAMAKYRAYEQYTVKSPAKEAAKAAKAAAAEGAAPAAAPAEKGFLDHFAWEAPEVQPEGRG